MVFSAACLIQSVKDFLRPAKHWFKHISTLKHTGKSMYCTKETFRCDDDLSNSRYRYETRGENTPVCCATHLYEILRDVDRILRQGGIAYFMTFGTLLGAVRHGGMISWDTDVDLAISDQDKDRAFSLLESELGKQYHIYFGRVSCRAVGAVIRVDYSKINTLHVDIYTYIDHDNSIVLDEGFVLKKTSIFPCRQLSYYDLQLYAPADYVGHLELIFGEDYMTHAYRQWAANKKKFAIEGFAPAMIDKNLISNKNA